MSVTNIISLFGGLALFLFGMRLMGDGLERAAGPRLKSFLAFMTRNRFIAMLTGIAVTAMIQSSGATVVMVVGFVNANLLTLAQAVGVILGANVGTTVTSLLLSIPFDPGAVFAVLGMLMTLAPGKRETVRQAGYVLIGLGILFVGMNEMSRAMAPLREWPLFIDFMRSVQNPILGVLTGALVTALLQSSSVSVGLVQVLAAGGLVSMEGALFLVLGANIGSCTPSLLAMTNSSVSARRAAMIHLLSKVVGTALMLVATIFLPVAGWAEAAFPGNAKLAIAALHIGFNIICTLLLLPAEDWLVKLACLIVRGEDPEEKTLKLRYYDERLLKTPVLAAGQLYRETCRMGREAHEHIEMALHALETADLSQAEEITYHEELSDYLEEKITEGLVAVMSLELTEQESRRVAALFHVVTDIERISDHADNLFDLAKEREARHADLSEKAVEELSQLFEKVQRVLAPAFVALEEWGISDSVLSLLEDAEQQVDDMTELLRKKHIERLKAHKCAPKSGVIFLEAIGNLERVSDHALNIAMASRGDAALHKHQL